MNSKEKELEAENESLKKQLEELAEVSENTYSQINKLLLWKSALKVKVNEACPFLNIIGKEGYVSDLFPNGFTIWHIKEDGEYEFWRLEAEWLDIVRWDQEFFEKTMAKHGYQQVKGIWTHKDKI